MEDAVDLVEQALEEPEVAACQAGDSGSSLNVSKVVGIEFLSQFLPLLPEDELHLVARKRRIWMGKTDAAVELRVAAHAFFDAGHADEDQADLGAVELVTQMFQGRIGQPFGLIDDDQLHLSASGTYDLDVF